MVNIATAAVVGYWPDLRGRMEPAQTVVGSDLEEAGNLNTLEMAVHVG